MATIKFILQSESTNAAIYVRLSVGKNNTPKRKSRMYIDSKNWSTSKGYPVEKDVGTKNLKTKLIELESYIMKLYNSDDAKGLLIDGAWLEKTIDKFHDRIEPENLDYLIAYGEHFIKRLPYRISAKGKKGVDKDTITKYSTIVEKLRGFQTHMGKTFLLKDVNLLFRDEFLEYLETVDRISDNTAGRYISFVKTIVLNARKNGHAVNPQIDDFKGFTIKAPIVTLTLKEIERLKNTLYTDDKLSAARDWLVLSCFLGQRASDLLRMTQKMIVKKSGYRFIVLTQQKGGKPVEIPLHPEVEIILRKRNGQFPPVFSANPGSNSALYDRLLKDVCFKANINEVTEGNLLDPKTKRYGTGNYPKWMLVASHIGRRSFATNFYAKREYPTPLLMTVTGHATETMFLQYIGKKPFDYGLQLAELWAEKEATDTINMDLLTPLKAV